MRQINTIEWVLRVGVFGTFLGHGLFAILHKPQWLIFITYWGVSNETGWVLMTIIGIVDVLIAIVTLVHPHRPVLIYAIIWAFLTALMRPLTGGYLLDFVERATNWAAPLALYLLITTKYKKSVSSSASTNIYRNPD